MRTIAALTLTAVCATACASGKTSTAPTTPPRSSSTPASTSARPAKLGQKQTDSDPLATITATVYAYKVLASTYPPDRKGYEYGGADTRLCVVKTDGNRSAGISWGPWSLAFPDDSTIDSASSWSADWFRVPLYPGSEKLLRPGQCVRGWILFEVPKGKHPSKVVYAPESAASPTEWAL